MNELGLEKKKKMRILKIEGIMVKFGSKTATSKDGKLMQLRLQNPMLNRPIRVAADRRSNNQTRSKLIIYVPRSNLEQLVYRNPV